MAEKKRNTKRIPDPARRDLIGVYYSQMKLWQGIAFILAVSVAVLLYVTFFRTKHHYFYTSGYEIVKLQETSPKVDAFLNVAMKKMFSVSYLQFDKDVEKMRYYLSPEAFQRIKEGMNSLRGLFMQGKLIWIPSSPEIYTKETKDGVFFTAKLKIREVIVSQQKEGVKTVTVTGKVIAGTPEGDNLFPYRLSDLKIKFGGEL